MFDFGLHFRFLQKATEAFFEIGQASVAASLAWQSRVHEELTSDHSQTARVFAGWPAFSNWLSAPAVTNQTLGSTGSQEFSPWNIWLAAWTPVASSTAEWVSDPATSWRSVATAWQNLTSPNAASGWQTLAAAGTLRGATPWTFYQGPLMAMMLSFGVPYAVAAPTARASTSAMDAAEAAYTQWRRMFAITYENARVDWPPSPNSPWSRYLH